VRGPTTLKQLGAVTVSKLMVTSKQTRIEPSGSFTAASVDPTAVRKPAVSGAGPLCSAKVG
jgi:hypothetical protein